jgi:hypothetical protein
LGFVSCYSPIQDDGKGVNTAGVPYYGMLAFAVARAGCAELLPIEIGTQRDNVTGYVLGSAGKPRSLIIVNRDRSQDAHISFTELKMGAMSALRLTAPSAESTSDVIFGGASVDAEGHWKQNTRERIRDGSVTVSKMNAIVLRSAG